MAVDSPEAGRTWESERFAFSFLSESVEQRIGQDAVRTRRILNAYHQHINPEWPTLVFATSVGHSKTVAAMLNRERITARAVWGETKAPVRRGIVEDFRQGKIRALLNYGVFREGFDAPKTRAIVVARVEDNFENFEGRLAFSELDCLGDKP